MLPSSEGMEQINIIDLLKTVIVEDVLRIKKKDEALQYISINQGNKHTSFLLFNYFNITKCDMVLYENKQRVCNLINKYLDVDDTQADKTLNTETQNDENIVEDLLSVVSSTNKSQAQTNDDSISNKDAVNDKKNQS